MKIATKLRLLRPTIEGRKYNERQSASAIRWNIAAEILSQRSTRIGVLMFHSCPAFSAGLTSTRLGRQ